MKKFSRSFNGYNVHEVNSFLDNIIRRVDLIIKEINALYNFKLDLKNFNQFKIAVEKEFKLKINKNKSFYVIKESVKKRASSKEKVELKQKNIAKYRHNTKFMNVDLGSSYALLNILSRYRNDDFSESTQQLVKNFYRVQGVFQKRNTSILAHGLLPINEGNANQLYKLTLKGLII